MRPENYNCSSNQQISRGDFNPNLNHNLNHNTAFTQSSSSSRNTCCCKKSMADSLKLLCDSQLASYIDFQKFAFLSPTFLVGSKLVLIGFSEYAKDNLAELTGEFKRFTIGNCDTIDISGTAVYNIPVPGSCKELRELIIRLLEEIICILRDKESTSTMLSIFDETLSSLKRENFSEALLKVIFEFLISLITVLPDVKQASLCEQQAIVFELEHRNDYNTFKELLQEELENTETGCGECHGHCTCDNCCCNSGIKFGLLSANASHTISLTAGNLVLRNVKALGNIGNTLVFGNEREARFYFVCADTVEFLA